MPAVEIVSQFLRRCAGLVFVTVLVTFVAACANSSTVEQVTHPDELKPLAFLNAGSSSPTATPVPRSSSDDFVQVLSGVEVLLLTEVYPAGEAPIAGADARSLSRAIRMRGRVEPLFVDQVDQLPALLERVVLDGDRVLLLGVGDIGGLAARVPHLLGEVA